MYCNQKMLKSLYYILNVIYYHNFIKKIHAIETVWKEIQQTLNRGYPWILRLCDIFSVFLNLISSLGK